METQQKIKPATYQLNHADEFNFKEKTKWKIILPILAFIFLLLFGYYLLQESRINYIKKGIQKAYDLQVLPYINDLNHFQNKIESLIINSKKINKTSFRDPNFKLDNIRDEQGLFFFVDKKDIQNTKDISKTSLSFKQEAITKCLGINPYHIASIYSKNQIIKPKWQQDLQEAHSIVKLKVYDKELKLRASRDIPLLKKLSQSKYFLLMLSNGSRQKNPLEFFLWDLHQNKLLIHKKIKAEGSLLTVPLDGHRRLKIDPSQELATTDCALAASLKEFINQPSVNKTN